VAAAKPTVAGIPIRIKSPIILPKLIEAVKRPDFRDQSYLHASSMDDYCPRERMIMEIFGLTAERPAFPLNMMWTFEIGKMIHARIQNELLGQGRVLIGKWRCVRCGCMVGGDMPDQWVPMPEEGMDCEAVSRVYSVGASPHVWKHSEAHAVDPELGIGGDIDGGVLCPDGEVSGLEIKSISQSGHSRLRGVMPEHKTQANVYMKLFGLRRQTFIYASKGWHPDAERTVKDVNGNFRNGPFYETEALRDEKVIADFVTKRRAELAAQKEAKETGGESYPPRLLPACATQFTGKAKSCPVKELCFSLDAE
jgi:hypothetical protein